VLHETERSRTVERLESNRRKRQGGESHWLCKARNSRATSNVRHNTLPSYSSMTRLILARLNESLLHARIIQVLELRARNYDVHACRFHPPDTPEEAPCAEP